MTLLMGFGPVLRTLPGLTGVTSSLGGAGVPSLRSTRASVRICGSAKMAGIDADEPRRWPGTQLEHACGRPLRASGATALTATATATVPATTTIGEGVSLMCRLMMALWALLPTGGQSPSSASSSSPAPSALASEGGGGGAGGAGLRRISCSSSSEDGRWTRCPGLIKSGSRLGLNLTSVSTPVTDEAWLMGVRMSRSGAVITAQVPPITWGERSSRI